MGSQQLSAGLRRLDCGTGVLGPGRAGPTESMAAAWSGLVLTVRLVGALLTPMPLVRMDDNLISLLVLLAWIPLRELPGLGTLLNVAIVGFAADATATVLPRPHGTPAAIGYLVLGLVALAFFDALYLGAQFGSGPRDGIMTGLVRLTGLPIAAVRTGIEITVATAGWLLGGTFGVGTVLVALCMGPLVGYFLPRMAVRLPAVAADARHNP